VALRLPDLLQLAAVVALPVGLILLQPDAGTALTFAPLLAAAVFVSGLRWRWIVAGLVVLAVLAPVGWSVLKPYQQDRLRIVVNPDLDPMGRGYHAVQSRIAVGSGGFTGQGFAKGPQNRHGFLPERHTDFIFAIIAEEWGFLGAVFVLGLYLLVIRRLADAAVLARERLGAFLCLGAMMFVSVHVIVNVGMVLGLMPTIGIPLPLLSFGGSSLLSTAALVALALNVRMRRFAR
jgi:rod shape determining protein RodA